MEDKIKYLEENIEKEKDMVKRMKEMSKLIELLNEYNKEITNEEIGWKKWKYDEEFGNLLYGDYNGGTFSEMYCISKRYGFIKRLVENNKIDFNKINYPLRYNSYYPDRFGIVSQSVNDYEEYLRVSYNEYETLLMLLSISDSPIDDLISYLK